MPYQRFTKDDVFHNVIITYPKYDIHVYNNKTYWNQKAGLTDVPAGHISLHEINVGRDNFDKVYPFVTKEGARSSFKTVSTDDFNDSSQFQFGDTITGSYPLSTSVNRIFIPAGTNISKFTFVEFESSTYIPAHANKKYINALKSTLDNSTNYSRHFAFSADSTPHAGDDIIWDKGTQAINMICVPSIYYGTRLRPGSVNLKYYSAGNLIGYLSDTSKNGELVEISGSNIGAVAGVVMYERGLMLLTGSWDITDKVSCKQDFEGASGGSLFPKWLHFGVGLPHVGAPVETTGITAASFQIEFEGENKIPTTTLMAHAEQAELNYSINPTYIDKTRQAKINVKDSVYSETQAMIKNTVQSSYTNHSASFERQTFISTVGIYDEDYNLIGIAKLATPVKKTEDLSYTFKLKLDY